MDRRRAAGALLALAACIATSTAAPTQSGNHTALDLYDGHTAGCYYNFRHYGEGDRIMTNEPCLNCTCHNRMLMCYLRVCPFTKAIGQDCTVEKRADQCCPIVTCPDVPVDLLTTSTSSPAEYGGTGVGKVDNYGCSINGKYLPEGAKVPQTPGKPCEHCYCIRNMTTCVMQECTLHVDGCTPIYSKDVCCPIRYFCDHPEEEMPLLDDMTTTVRPTPGFLLTTTTTEEPTTQTMKKDCLENDRLVPDGAMIKTEKPCEHCYCMKGDIVCVVQECGTPMENEGKNCTSLPPREGQCCPDTYICEGDEVSTDIPLQEITTLPSRRVSVEGSGYRHDDEIPYTDAPDFETEGSGEEETSRTPLYTDTLLDVTEKEMQHGLSTTSVPITTEPDKGLNTVPNDISGEDITEYSLLDKTTQRLDTAATETPFIIEQDTTHVISESAITDITTSSHEEITEHAFAETTTTGTSDKVDKITEHASTDKTSTYTEISTKSSITEPTTETMKETTFRPQSEEAKTTDQPNTTEPSVIIEESSQPSITDVPFSKETTKTEISGTEENLITDVEQTTKPSISHDEISTGTTVSYETTSPSIKKTEDSTETKEPEVFILDDKYNTGHPESDIAMHTTQRIDKLRPDLEGTETPISEEIVPTTDHFIQKDDKTSIAPETTYQEKTESSTTSLSDIIKETTVLPYYQSSSAETSTTSVVQEGQSSTAQLPSEEEEPKKLTTESFIELTTFAHITEKETSVPTTLAADKIDITVTTTINPEENEIGEEVLSPARIPGEGDCLINSITYKNNSAVPSSNKCLTSCKCVSSIIKCDPIMCSSPPDMQNCQTVYDPPDSCCPTYVCDHLKETIPPQPHSQMSGTESPTSASEIDCHGNECGISEEQLHPIQPTSSSLPEKCIGDKCAIPEPSCTDDKCELPPKVVPTVCENPDQCKDQTIPETAPPCVGDSCIVDKDQPKPCEGANCQVKPVTIVPEVCANEEECKESKIPDVAAPPCEGESCIQSQDRLCTDNGDCEQPSTIPCDGEQCKKIPHDTVTQEERLPETPVSTCEGESCYIGTTPTPEIPEVCSEENGCKKPETELCHDEECRRKDRPGSELPAVCTGSDCMVSQPEQDLPKSTTPTSVNEPITETEMQKTSVSVPEGSGAEGPSEIPEDKVSVPQITEPELPTSIAPEDESSTDLPIDKSPEATSAPQDKTHTVLPESLTSRVPQDESHTELPVSLTTVKPWVTSEDTLTSKPLEEFYPGVFQLPETSTLEEETQPESSTGTTTGDVMEDTRKKLPETSATALLTELPEPSTTTVSLESSTVIPESQSPEQHTTTMIQDETDTESPEVYGTKVPHDEIGTENPVTKAAQDESRTATPELSLTTHVEIQTQVPETTAAGERQDEAQTELPKSPATEPPGTSVTGSTQDETQTKLPESSVTAELPESTVANVLKDETQTKMPEFSSTKLPEQQDENRTELDSLVTTQPEEKDSIITRKPQDEMYTETISTSKPQSETQPETPGQQDEVYTVIPELPVTSAEEGESQTELPEAPSAPQPEAHADLPESSTLSAPQDETHTKSAESQPDLPLTSAPHDEMQTKLPEIFATAKPEYESPLEKTESPITNIPLDDTQTEIPVPSATSESGPKLSESTSAPKDETTERSESPVTTSTQEKTEQPESSATSGPQEETQSELSESPVPTSAPEGESSERLPEDSITVTPQAEDLTEVPLMTSVSQDEAYTRQPELPATNAPQDELTPKSPVTDLSHDVIHTEQPELPVTGTQDELATEIPETSVSSTPHSETHTEQPELLATGTQQSKLPPESYVTETVVDEVQTMQPESPSTSVLDDKLVPELPEMPITISPHDKIYTEQPEAPVTRLPEQPETPVTSVSHDEGISVTKQPESLSTGAPQDELSSEPPVTSVSHDEDDTERPESPVTSESHDILPTELPESPLLIVPHDDFTKQPELSATDTPQDTLPSEVPEAHITGVPHEEVYTEHPESPATTESPHDEFSPGVPEPPITSAPDESEATDEIVPERPEEPITNAPHDESFTKQPEAPVIDVPHDELPEQPDTPVTSAPSDRDYTEQPEPPATGAPQDKLQTVLPESPVTSEPHEELFTELPEISITSVPQEKLQTNIPEAPTSAPQGEILTELPEVQTTKEKLESPVTQLPQGETDTANTEILPSTPNDEIYTVTSEPSVIREGPETTVSSESPLSLVTKQQTDIETERPDVQKTKQPETHEIFVTTLEPGKLSTEVSQEAATDNIPPVEPVSGTTETVIEKTTEPQPTSLTQKEITEYPKAPATPTSEKEFAQTIKPVDELSSEAPITEKIPETPQDLTTQGHETSYITESSISTSPEDTTIPSKDYDLQTDVPVSIVGPEMTSPQVPSIEDETIPHAGISSTSSSPEQTYSETTPFLDMIELHEHTHIMDEEMSTPLATEEITTARTEHKTQLPEITTQPSFYVEKIPVTTTKEADSEPEITVEQLSTTTGLGLEDKFVTESDHETPLLTTKTIPTETEKPLISEEEVAMALDKNISSTIQPTDVSVSTDISVPEEEIVAATVKPTTAKVEEELTTQSPVLPDTFTEPDKKPSEAPAPMPESPSVLQPSDEVPTPEDESQFPETGGYGQEPDYVEEDQAFGPGTCRYGGKVYVSAQQIPRDDPCDFCFCFRSDIICLQQSCPPPIHGCHEEPIQGFCCPRYECPVAMATTLNVTTTTTTTTTTLPPHFLPHAYKGAAQRRGCQIKGHTYKVGEVVRASSGPCLHCTCGGDGQMKCDPKACTPEPMLRQMIAAAVSAKRRR